jgi:hypothetical protein
VADLEIRYEPTWRRLGRALARELVWLAWALAASISSIVGLVVLDGVPVRIGLVLGLAWCVFQGRNAIRVLLRKHRILTSGIPTLKLGDLDVRIRHLFGNLDGAALAWADCAAVVVSKAPKDPSAWVDASRYVRFVPLAPDRVEGQPRQSDSRAGLLDLTPHEALTVWLELVGQSPGADEVVAWLRTHRPTLRIVGAGQSSDE